MSIYIGDKLVTNAYLGGVQIVEATLYNPSIATGSLVLLLDTTNLDSYPGSGSVWKDLSGYDNDAYLTAITETFYTSSAFGGYFFYPYDANPGGDYDQVPIVSGSVSLNIFDGDFSVLMVGSIDQTYGSFRDTVGFFSMPDGNTNPSVAYLINRNVNDVLGNYKKSSPWINATNLGNGGPAFNALGEYFVNYYIRENGVVSVYNTDNDLIFTTGSAAAGADGNNAGPLYIGRYDNSPLGSYMIQEGKVVVLGMYGRALSDLERQQNIDYYRNTIGF